MIVNDLKLVQDRILDDIDRILVISIEVVDQCRVR